MKKLISSIILSQLCFFGNYMFSQTKLDTGISVEVNGKVAHLSSKYGNTYKVELLCNDKVLDAKTVQNNKEFSFMVPKNAYCAIRISKRGYISRLISVYSHLQLNESGYYRFGFETELIEEEKATSLNKDLLDFPITIISFDKDINGFYYNEEYTSNIKRELFLNVSKRNTEKSNL